VVTPCVHSVARTPAPVGPPPTDLDRLPVWLVVGLPAFYPVPPLGCCSLLTCTFHADVPLTHRCRFGCRTHGSPDSPDFGRVLRCYDYGFPVPYPHPIPRTYPFHAGTLTFCLGHYLDCRLTVHPPYPPSYRTLPLLPCRFSRTPDRRLVRLPTAFTLLRTVPGCRFNAPPVDRSFVTLPITGPTFVAGAGWITSSHITVWTNLRLLPVTAFVSLPHLLFGFYPPRLPPEPVPGFFHCAVGSPDIGQRFGLPASLCFACDSQFVPPRPRPLLLPHANCHLRPLPVYTRTTRLTGRTATTFEHYTVAYTHRLPPLRTCAPFVLRCCIPLGSRLDYHCGSYYHGALNLLPGRYVCYVGPRLLDLDLWITDYRAPTRLDYDAPFTFTATWTLPPHYCRSLYPGRVYTRTTTFPVATLDRTAVYRAAFTFSRLLRDLVPILPLPRTARCLHRFARLPFGRRTHAAVTVAFTCTDCPHYLRDTDAFTLILLVTGLC